MERTQRPASRTRRTRDDGIRIVSNHTENQPTPAVGIACNGYIYGDRFPYTVVAVVGDRTVRVQRDRIDFSLASDGHAPVASIRRHESGETFAVTLRKNGLWVKQGESQYVGERFDFANGWKYHMDFDR